MKKKLIALLAGALLTLGMAGNALAYFGNGELNFYSYGNTVGTPEVGVDLGSISSLLTAGTTTTITAGAAAITGLSYTTYLYAGLYGYDATTQQLYIAADAGKTLTFNAAQYSAFMTKNTNVNSTYAGASQVKTLASKGTAASSTYFGKMDGGVNYAGTYGSIIPTNNGGDFRTTLLADVVKHIYMVDLDSGNLAFVDTGATATFLTSGNIQINGTPTPIPPSFLLMGSGLLGIIGLRRKKA